MYDAPSLRADKLYVADRYLPVEVVVDVDGWAKVRDSSGSLAWVEKKVLSQQRYVVVTVPVANIHQSADINSELVFQAEENIVMEWIDSDVKGWVKYDISMGRLAMSRSIRSGVHEDCCTGCRCVGLGISY